MFGRPHWFYSPDRPFGLTPRCWQGWCYTAVWAAVLLLPYLLLVGRQLGPEAFVWLTFGLGGLAWDVRTIRRAWDEPVEVREVFVIDESGARSELR